MEGVNRFELKNVALQTFLRQRTPRWLSQFLGINVDENISLEDLFADCWVLGRVADVAQDLVVGRSFVPKTLPPRAGHRSHREVLSDMERFQKLCDTLNLPLDSRIVLADVLEHRSGVRVALCLWACSDALHKRMPDCKQIPSFASPDEVSSLYRTAPGEVNAARIQIYEKLSEASHTPSPRLTPGKSPSQTSTWTPSPGGGRHLFSENVIGAKDHSTKEDAEISETDASLDLLSSLLLPQDRKPSHLQLLTSIMRSDDKQGNEGNDDVVVNGTVEEQNEIPSSEKPVVPKTSRIMVANSHGGLRSMKRMSFIIVASLSAVIAVLGCGVAFSNRSIANGKLRLPSRRRELVHQGRW